MPERPAACKCDHARPNTASDLGFRCCELNKCCCGAKERPAASEQDDDGDALADLMDELDADEREEERLLRQATLYAQSPKRGDHD